MALGVDLHLFHSRTAPEVVLEALFHPGLADHRARPVAVDAGTALVVLVPCVLGPGDLADVTEDIGRRIAVGVIAHRLGLDHHAGQERLVLVYGEHGGGADALGNGHRLVRAVLDTVDGRLHPGHGLAQQGGQLLDDTRVGLLRPGQDADHLLDAVARQQHAIAVEDLAPGRREVNRYNALSGDLGDGGGAGLDTLQEPEPAEKSGEETGHHHQHGRGPQAQRTWLRRRRGNRLSHALYRTPALARRRRRARTLARRRLGRSPVAVPPGVAAFKAPGVTAGPARAQRIITNAGRENKAA